MTATILTPETGLPDPLSEDELASLDEESFIDYVHDSLPSTELFVTALHRPLVAHRTATALGVLLRDLQQATAENRRELDNAEFGRWLSEFGEPMEALLMRRLARAKGAARGSRETRLKREIHDGKAMARHLMDVLGRLAEEIHVHRLAALAAGFEPEPHDRAMWASLSVLTVPIDGEDIQLDEALGRHLIGGAR